MFSKELVTQIRKSLKEYMTDERAVDGLPPATDADVDALLDAQIRSNHHDAIRVAHLARIKG